MDSVFDNLSFFTDSYKSTRSKYCFLNYVKFLACITRGYYDCTKCSCDLTKEAMRANLIICMVAIIIISLLILAFFLVKPIRQKPGDLIFGLALAELIHESTWLVFIYRKEEQGLDGFEMAKSEFCLHTSYFNYFSKNLAYVYAFCFFFYVAYSMKNPLKSSASTTILYHLISWLVPTGLTIYRYKIGSLGENIYGVCSDKTALTYFFDIFL